MKKLTLLTFLLLFGYFASAQIERIYPSPYFVENSEILTRGDKVIFFVNEYENGINRRSFFIMGDLNMNHLDTFVVPKSHHFQNLSSFCPIGDSMYVATGVSQDSGNYNLEFIFLDTTFNVINRKPILDTSVLAGRMVAINDSFIYTTGTGYYLNGCHIGKFTLDGSLVRDTFYPNRTYISTRFESISPSKFLAFQGLGEWSSIDKKTLALKGDSILFGAGIGKIIKHSSGNLYSYGFFLAGGFDPKIGVQVKKMDASGMLQDSAFFFNRQFREVWFNYDEACELKNGNLLFAYSQDSGHAFNYTKAKAMKLVMTDENLNTIWKKSRYFPGLDLLVSAAVGTSDGGASLLGTITDSVNYTTNLYYLHIDSLGNFSPLTIFDNDAPSGAQLSLYPNPADDQVFIKGLDDQAIIDVFVTDVSGALVEKKELVYPFRLETNHLVSGVYSLLVADKRGNSFMLKMIKN